MPDYGCWPIWHVDDYQVGNIDPKNLGISSNLEKDLTGWASIFDSHLNLENPSSTTWTEKELNDFDNEGRRLALALLEEIGERYKIYYSVDLIPAESLRNTA